jgi:hypothetical protein
MERNRFRLGFAVVEAVSLVFVTVVGAYEKVRDDLLQLGYRFKDNLLGKPVSA